MQVYPIRYRKAALDAVAEEERLLFLTAGQLANDIASLTKLAAFSRSYAEDAPWPIKHGQMAVVTMNIKFLISRTFEGWKVLNEQPIGPTFRAYKDEFPPEALASLRVLGRAFGGDNLLGKLRNKVGFHLDIPTLKEGYDAIGADEELIDYIGKQVGNSLYYAAELSSVMAMVQLTGLGLVDALNQIIDRATEASGHLTDVLQAILMIFSTRHLGVTAENIIAAPIQLQGPVFTDVLVPFFTEPPTKEYVDNLLGG